MHQATNLVVYKWRLLLWWAGYVLCKLKACNYAFPSLQMTYVASYWREPEAWGSGSVTLHIDKARALSTQNTMQEYCVCNHVWAFECVCVCVCMFVCMCLCVIVSH
jgi:hypothetical protein